MSLVLIFLFSFNSYGYNPSLYAPSTDDYIIALESDSFYFIENVPTPEKAKPISEAHFSSETINEDSYGWPGHDKTITQELEDEEGINMYNFYKNRVNLTENDMYYHPKAPEQSWSTWENINPLQRTKVKVTLDPYHYSFRTTNLYMPPGELIKFEIPPDAINLVKVIIEPHRQHVTIKQRLKYLQCETTLTQPTTTWGYPTGGAVSFELVDRSKNLPIEINVTGCILAPHFIYGVTDEREWEETIRNLQAPSAMITNGAISMFMPANVVRTMERMDDVQAWWRSAALRSQEIAPDPMSMNDKYRIRHPLNWRYDNYVGCGIACAYAGGNVIDFTPDWANDANNIRILTKENPWGSIHEMNHHHQDGWAFRDLDPSLSEGTNNVLNAFTYTYQNSASAKRTVDQDLNPVCLVDHLETVHPYCLVDWAFIECEWDIIFHVFGREVFKHYLDLNIKNEPYSWQLYNGYGKHILTLMEATGYDCYEYCKWYCDNTGRNSPQELIGDKFDSFWNAYINHPAYGKPIHFMGCFYACGFIRNNQRFETARPYRINPKINTTFDFNKALKQRSGNKTLWGDFEFDRIQSNRQDAWTETSKGVFQYKPVDDLSFIDEALAFYVDKTTGEEFINIIRLELKPVDRVHKTYYYNFTEDVCNRDMSVEDCYKNLDKCTLYKTIEDDYRGIPWISERNLTAVTDFHFTPTKTSDFNVRASISERGFVYISDQPLKGNYEDDKDHLVLVKHYWHGYNAGDVNGGLAVFHFEKGKKYYIRLVVNNADKPSVCVPGQDLCRPQIGETVFFKETEHNIYVDDSNVIPESWFELHEPLDFRPDLIDFKYNDVYEGDQLLKNNPAKWSANVSMAIKSVYNLTNTDYDYSQGKECIECDDTNVSETLTNWDPFNEVRSGWWPPDTKGQPFPHKWDVNFNGEENFDTIYLKGAYNQNHFPMDSDILIYVNKLESSSADIEKEDNLIYQGVYKSKDNKPITFDNEIKGKYLRIVVNNNRLEWRGGHPGRSTFAFISVGKRLILSKYKVPRGCNWEVRKDGYYLNGRAFVGKAGDEYTYIPDEGINQVAILGDRFVGMGKAKVYLNNILIKTIEENDIDIQDLTALKYASRSYRRILCVTPFFNNKPELRIVVESGEFRLTGFIVGSNDESVIINNGPLPTETPTAYPEPTEIPKQTQVPVPPVITETKVPVPPVVTETEEVIVPPPVVTETKEIVIPPPVVTETKEPAPPIVTETKEVIIPPPVVTETKEPAPPVVTETKEVIVPPPVVTDTKEPATPVVTETKEVIVPPPVVTDTKEPAPPVVTETKEVIVPTKAVTINPTEPPVVAPLPSIDSTSQASGDKIEFTENGFKDSGNEHDTSAISSDIVLIKGTSTSITLTVDYKEEPKQDKYLSLQQPNTEVTISLPPSGDFGKSEFGIHPNSSNPKINIPTSSVPLNIYNDQTNVISLQTPKESTKESITILKVTSTNGKLSLKLPENTKYIEAKEVNIFNNGIIESISGSSIVDTVIHQLNLKDGSNSVVSNVNIKSTLNADSNTKLNIEGKAVFDEKSSVKLTDTSFIDFGTSIINGICDKLILVSSNRRLKEKRIKDDENGVSLICGVSFDCEKWSEKFEGNDDFPASKCSNVDNKKCLVAVRNNADDPSSGGGGSKGKSNTGVIVAVVVVVIVVVVVAAVVGFVLYKKKKRANTSSVSFKDDMKETLHDSYNNTNDDLQDI